MSQKIWIMGFVLTGCILMALVDGSSMDYVSKAVFKISTFISLPLIFSKWIGHISLRSLFIVKLTLLKTAFGLGLILYGLILILFIGLGSFFDLSMVSGILDKNFTAGTLNFLPVALYIALINSFIEEFFFRGFAYLCLKRVSTEGLATWFSALCFSFYHLFLMAGLVEFSLYLSAIVVLVFAGVLFNRLDRASNSLYPSWLLHGFANLGLNTIGFILLKIL